MTTNEPTQQQEHNATRVTINEPINQQEHNASRVTINEATKQQEHNASRVTINELSSRSTTQQKRHLQLKPTSIPQASSKFCQPVSAYTNAGRECGSARTAPLCTHMVAPLQVLPWPVHFLRMQSTPGLHCQPPRMQLNVSVHGVHQHLNSLYTAAALWK